MKKLLSILLAFTFIFALCGVSVMAAELTVEAPVEMTFVKETDGNYEYSVTANVKADPEVATSIMMFGNKDNSAFVAGDKLDLTVDEITSKYSVYYVNQETTDADGKASFTFNVILPTPAKDDLYYVRVGAENVDKAAELDKDSLSVYSEIVAVKVAAGKNTYIKGEEVNVTATAENVFGEVVDADVNVTVKKGDEVSASGIGSVANQLTFGNYVAYATAANGASAEADFAVVILGDADTNGKLSVMDAVNVLKTVADTYAPDEHQAVAADVNKDGVINVQDAIAVLKYIARISNTL